MDEKELLRQKYRYLLQRLYNISDKMNNLEQNFDDLIVSLKENIECSDNIVNEEYYNRQKNNITYIENELNNQVISNINYKI
ncbi:MAG TPA: hypothetical protein IAB45_05480 [Candidatus Onthousia faecavium]|nr:hypothetical protein [Candidatus Onthousia faecavium]